MSIQRVLIVDDDDLSREFLSEAVRSLGFQAESVASGDQALEKVRNGGFQAVITDLRMPGIDGIELIRQISASDAEIKSVLVTAHGTVQSAVDAMRFGASDFLLKPCTVDSIQIVLERLNHSMRLEHENEYLRTEARVSHSQQVVAESAAMVECLQNAARIAASKGTVLLTGPSGTGKERVAHFIHEKSDRRDKPFVRVNCAALSEQLLESELFGHERGAFTGATKTRPGRFELADGGTLLLDEIGEIVPSLQTKLLRVLQEEEFERVGGNTTIKVDVRVIATTNRSLPDEVAAGNFREDLYYRLHVLPIQLASLSERRADILPLAFNFANFYAQQNGFKTPEFTQAAQERLKAWTWPGNVRELENVIQRAVVLQQGRRIDAEHLMFGPSGQQIGAPVSPYFSGEDNLNLTDYLANRPLADIERESILATLNKTGGNKSEAARRLGVTARTLSNKMKIWKQMGFVA